MVIGHLEEFFPYCLMLLLKKVMKLLLLQVIGTGCSIVLWFSVSPEMVLKMVGSGFPHISGWVQSKLIGPIYAHGLPKGASLLSEEEQIGHE